MSAFIEIFIKNLAKSSSHIISKSFERCKRAYVLKKKNDSRADIPVTVYS
jgi:hypothetical protein